MATKLPHPETSEADVHAWRALFLGRADADQQIRVVQWLARATMRDSIPYVPGPEGERDTILLLGQQRIGVMIGNMATPETLAAARAHDKKPDPPTTRGTRNAPKPA